MSVVFKRTDNGLLVKLSGEIDAESANELRRKIDVEYELVSARDMILDLSDVHFMDSSGIGMIIGRYKKVCALGGTVKAFGADKTVGRIIELSGLGKIVKMYKNEREAVR